MAPRQTFSFLTPRRNQPLKREVTGYLKSTRVKLFKDCPFVWIRLSRSRAFSESCLSHHQLLRDEGFPVELGGCLHRRRKQWAGSLLLLFSGVWDVGGPGEGAEHGFKRVMLLPQSCSTLCDPSRGSSRHRDRTPVSSIAGELFTDWATKEALKRVSCAINRTKIITKGQSCLEQPVGRNAPKQSIPCWRDSADWNSFMLENVAERCNKGMWRYALHLRMDFKAWFVGQWFSDFVDYTQSPKGSLNIWIPGRQP